MEGPALAPCRHLSAESSKHTHQNMIPSKKYELNLIKGLGKAELYGGACPGALQAFECQIEHKHIRKTIVKICITYLKVQGRLSCMEGPALVSCKDTSIGLCTPTPTPTPTPYTHTYTHKHTYIPFVFYQF